VSPGLPRLDLAVVIAINLVPAAGALMFGWNSYDLIFLYWMENVVIGAFTVLRMLARPYTHPIELAFPLFFAPFFALHYGGFCWGHGTFVVALFGDGEQPLTDAVRAAVDTTPILLALLALVALQTFDWIRDTQRHGFGSDGIKDLMTAPYRRIVVLHLTIIGGGFVLTALGEPAVGLLVLAAIKTASDVWHWRHDSAAGAKEEADELSSADLARMAEKFPEPKVQVNGTEKLFASFRELKRSSEFRMMQSVLRLMGATRELGIVNRYIDLRIAEEGSE
jgi:hypothetical protein